MAVSLTLLWPIDSAGKGNQTFWRNGATLSSETLYAESCSCKQYDVYSDKMESDLDIVPRPKNSYLRSSAHRQTIISPDSIGLGGWLATGLGVEVKPVQRYSIGFSLSLKPSDILTYCKAKSHLSRDHGNYNIVTELINGTKLQKAVTRQKHFWYPRLGTPSPNLNIFSSRKPKPIANFSSIYINPGII